MTNLKETDVIQNTTKGADNEGKIGIVAEVENNVVKVVYYDGVRGESKYGDGYRKINIKYILQYIVKNKPDPVEFYETREQVKERIDHLTRRGDVYNNMKVYTVSKTSNTQSSLITKILGMNF